MKNYRELFDRFQEFRIMVLGDVMLDSYIFGKVDRISPEAPVPVVQVEKRVNRLGGAANVALNITSLGAGVVLCSVIGDDPRGIELRQLASDSGIDGYGLLMSRERITTTKFRVIGNKTQMIRVDEEDTHPLSSGDEQLIMGRITEIIKDTRVDAIILQDYNKGVLTPRVIEHVISLSLRRNIPVCVDPKKENFFQFRKATLFKPNLKELREGLNREINPDNFEELTRAADFFHKEMQIPYFMATLSDKGAFISKHSDDGDSERYAIPAHVRNIADVSGAGDTVISAAALCLAGGMNPYEIATIANLAGGLVCEEVGVVPVNREKLLNEVITLR